MDTPRPKTTSRIPKTEPPEKFDPEATFKPSLVSSPDIRAKVQSSSYGKAVAIIKPKDATPSEREIQEQKELTFKPDLSLSSKTRVSVTSSGYGKTVVHRAPKEVDNTPSFKPDNSLTKTKTKRATASGYGKTVPQKKEIDSSLHIPDFKPKMDFGKGGVKMRKKVQPRLLEPQRPKTAPPGPPKQDHVPLHTLAADHSDKDAQQRSESVGNTFDLSELPVIGVLNGPKASPITKMPLPVTPTKAGQKLKENAPGSGYGSTWSPAVKPVTPKQTPPPIHAGKATTYVEKAAEIPKVQSKQIESAQARYGADYEVPVKEPPVIKPAPKVYYPSKTDSIAPLDELSPVEPSKKNKNAVPSYGKDYVPLQNERKSPPRPRTPPFNMTRDPIPTVEELPPVERKEIDVKSSGYKQIDNYSVGHNETVDKAAEGPSPKRFPDEQTTML